MYSPGLLLLLTSDPSKRHVTTVANQWLQLLRGVPLTTVVMSMEWLMTTEATDWPLIVTCWSEGLEVNKYQRHCQSCWICGECKSE